ncbi:minor capsid protein [Fusobacterium necrophorum]|uniref:minor capsid protein n=1 Tax=Fusobacterium necrophorum TaxID=859 RepID=UPI0001BC58FB
MAKMSKEYWEKRQHEREAKAYSSILEVEKEYKEALERAKLNINKQISHIGTTYMKDNQLSYAEATKQLKGTEYKVWRKQLDEYMQEWKQLKRTAPVEAKKLWLEIETLSARSRISRLDTIRTQIDIELSKVSSEAVESTRKALYGVYGDTYQGVMKDLGIKSMFSDSMVKAVIDRPWSGANYSSRLWGNSEKLARVLKQEVTTGLIQGINLKTMGKRISDRIEGAKKNDVERLLRTEVNYTMNQATLDGYRDAKIEKYTFDATLDSRTSQICAELNGETFELGKAAVGVNYPPMHPRCRSTTTPVIDFEALGEKLRKEKDLQEFEKESMINEKEIKIAGVVKGEPMTFDEADTGKVNPNYGVDRGYSINCQSCVPTFEARLRGYDVQTLANTKGSMPEKLSRYTNMIWIDPKTGKNPEYIFDDTARTPKKYLEFIKKTIEPNARYSIEFTWKGRENSGHIVNLDLNPEGLIRIKDNQRGINEDSEWIGDKEVLKYLSEMKYEIKTLGLKIPVVPKILRIDNMDFDLDVANKIMEAKKNDFK